MSVSFRPYARKPFDAEGCTQCGLCLSRCPVMELPRETAREAIRSLAEHQSSPEALPQANRDVLRKCTACFACNLICPEDCRPANLFLDIWHTQYTRQGLPESARYFLPYSRPNYRTYVLDRLTGKERDALRSWALMDPAETLFYPGCNMLLTPSLMFSKLFDGLPIRGSLDYCCGEAYLRMGLYEHVEQAARRCTRYFRDLGAKTVYLACTGDLNMFTHVLPQFGADFTGIRFVPFLERVFEALESGALPVVKRFDGQTITIQDSCHAKLYRPDYFQWPRKILAFLGFECREAPKHADTALCCGIGGGISHDAGYGKHALFRGQRACLKNLRVAKAEQIGVYCSGCLEMLMLSESGRRTRHVLEWVQEAIGEQPAGGHQKAAINLALGVLRHQRGGSGRFFPPPIE